MTSVPAPSSAPVVDAAAGDAAAVDAAAVDDGCKVELHEDLGWALGAVFRAYVKATNVVMAEVPGGPRGYQVLAAAVQRRSGTQLALAQHLGIDRTVMTYLLDDIERAELIERRPDPADRRARQVVVTGKGEALVEELQQGLRRAEEHVLGGLFGDDRERFRTLLRTVAERVDARDPIHSACDAVETLEESRAPKPRRRSRRP
jgi:DNA-binding MarR family transcriptional regulator